MIRPDNYPWRTRIHSCHALLHMRHRPTRLRLYAIITYHILYASKSTKSYTRSTDRSRQNSNVLFDLNSFTGSPFASVLVVSFHCPWIRKDSLPWRNNDALLRLKTEIYTSSSPHSRDHPISHIAFESPPTVKSRSRISVQYKSRMECKMECEKVWCVLNLRIDAARVLFLLGWEANRIVLSIVRFLFVWINGCWKVHTSSFFATLNSSMHNPFWKYLLSPPFKRIVCAVWCDQINGNIFFPLSPKVVL